MEAGRQTRGSRANPYPSPSPLAPRPAQVTREEAERRILAQDEPYKLEP